MATEWLASAWQAGAWRRWLTDHGSLTRRLQSACPDFHVMRLRQGHTWPFQDELAAMGIRRRRLALVREVLLLCGDTPMVFAHSVIPLAGLVGPWAALAGLGNRPLGAALFADPRIHRHPLDYLRLDTRHPLYRAARPHMAGAARRLWARRSRFTLEGHAIMVTEVFLPPILQLS